MSLKNLSAINKIPKLFKNKLKNKRINKIYKSFEKSLNINESFIVAVSGGPDSLALAYLAKIYSIKKKVSSKFFIVDHKLRPNSTLEAKTVKKVLSKNLIKAEILTWRGKKPEKNIQSLARKKRFELLLNQCDKLKINNILFGHHQNDLIENFFIRMLRGSGLKGLVSLDKKSKTDDKNLLRPLLNQKKEDLIFISKHVFNFYVQDPSNDNDQFQRIKIRKLIDKFRGYGLDKMKLFKTIKNLQHSNSVVSYYVTKNLKENTFLSKKKDKLFLNKQFFQQPYEVVFRALAESIKLVGKKYYLSRGKKLDKMISDIHYNRLSRATLGGCIIEKVSQSVIIVREH